MIIWQNKSIFLVNYVFYLEFNTRIIFNEANFWDILLSSSRWENYLQKRTLIKYICSWHDKLIIVLLLNQVRPIDMLSDNDGRSISWNVALLSTFINEVINPLLISEKTTKMFYISHQSIEVPQSSSRAL